jgi:hypothetical protein
MIMTCTKQEALMILEKRFEEASRALLNFQATPATEKICLQGRITQLPTGNSLFMSPMASETVPFDHATFDDEEKLTKASACRKKLPWPSSRLGLHLSLCRSELVQDGTSWERQPSLRISKAL